MTYFIALFDIKDVPRNATANSRSATRIRIIKLRVDSFTWITPAT
jgi:hypothetical protein